MFLLSKPPGLGTWLWPPSRRTPGASETGETSPSLGLWWFLGGTCLGWSCSSVRRGRPGRASSDPESGLSLPFLPLGAGWLPGAFALSPAPSHPGELPRRLSLLTGPQAPHGCAEHAYTSTHKPMGTHTCTSTRTHITHAHCKLTCAHTQVHRCTHNEHTCTRIYMHAQTYTQVHTQTHAETRTHTRTHGHSVTRVGWQWGAGDALGVSLGPATP